MSRRHGEWELLGHDSDPVPGSPKTIGAEARRIKGIATTISDQIRRLRAIEKDDQILRGDYADGLRESCGNLADDLERVQGRFEQVGDTLDTWWEPVETAKTRTWNALQDAVAAQAVIDANPDPGPARPGAPEPTEAEQDAEDIRQGKHDGAVQDLADARAAFRRAMESYDEKAETVAEAIRAASDDDMKDSGWDKFKSWVDANAGWLKKVADIISIVVTVVAVIALFCTPAGWILAIVAGIALLGVGIRFALAASGNGSWTDFALDLVGVLTLGTGKIATALAKGARMTSLSAIGKYTGNLARADAIANARTMFQNARWLDKPMVWLTRSNPVSRWIAGRAAYTSTRLSWVTKELPEVTKIETIVAGMDDTGAAMMKEINALRSAFPQLTIPGLDAYSRSVDVAVTAARTGTIVDFTDKMFGSNDVVPGLEYPGLGGYNDVKDMWSYGPGGHLG